MLPVVAWRFLWGVCVWAFLCLLQAVPSAQACLVAHQSRLVPLGFAGKTLHLLQLELRRKGESSLHIFFKKKASKRRNKRRYHAYWSGRAWLRTLSKDGRLSRKKRFFRSVRIPDKRSVYLSRLKRLVQRACKKIKGLKPFMKMNSQYCRFHRDCGRWRIWGNKRGRVFLYKKRSKGEMNAQRKRFVKKKVFKFSQSARLFLKEEWVSSSGRYVLFRISAGPASPSPPRYVPSWKSRRCKTTDKCLSPALALHHGKAMDVIVVE
ncbi:MAG TPA: hypothetical protein DCE42_06115 [Myxococcales bacterium]|nr:hypothetical protein [Myxococcales bacterium]